ncbi:MAG: class I SAM-dependent methyltransferase [Burkholderiales bacterium]|nr:class I SAM-dependent methyltransferase [Burkholderiales bacterium]
MQPVVAIPQYLHDTYWWAYVHPKAVKLFERQWLVNLILWGNFAKLRDAALAEMGATLPGRSLQVACVYGDFTPRLAERVASGGTLDVVDVLPVQLANLRRKLKPASAVNLVHRDAADLGFADASYERVILFFLLHEMPLDVRKRTLSEALRVLKPGGELVIVDYHKPKGWHPLRPLMKWILGTFEPFAMDLWRHEVAEWLPKGACIAAKVTSFGGLYQKLVVTRPLVDESHSCASR